MRLFIEPTEPLLFRTGRPFNAGENNFAETLFPPTPETLQGAIRATIAAHWDPEKPLATVFQQKELVNLIGDRSGYGRFRITGLALGRRPRDGGNIERLFPMPIYILEEEDGQKRQTRLAPRPKNKGVYTNLPDDIQLLYPEKELEGLEGKLEPKKGWLTEPGLWRILQETREIVKDELVREQDIYVRESRLGIGMNNTTKTTEERLLYQVQMIRMNHQINSPYIYGFVVDIRLTPTSEPAANDLRTFIDDDRTQKELHLPDAGWMILGGEQRAAHFEVIPPSKETAPNVEQLKYGRMLYLATPAAFTHGWQPKEWQTPFPSVKPIALAIDRYQPIGGWLLTPDSAGGSSKSIRRCVPAGSVYFFDKPVSVTQPLTEYGWQIGYGIAYTGDYES